MSTIRHFLTLSDLSSAELFAVLERAIDLKALTKRGEIYTPLQNRSLAMIFEKASTRTRVSFEVGMTQLGGRTMTMYNDAFGYFTSIEKGLCDINRIVTTAIAQFQVLAMSIRLSTLHQLLLSGLIFEHPFLSPFLYDRICIGIITIIIIIVVVVVVVGGRVMVNTNVRIICGSL